MEKLKVNLNFGGFYESDHADNIDSIICGIIEDLEIETNWDFWDLIPYSKLYTEYSKRLVDAFNNRFELSLEFIELDSPREYNFRTDKIVVDMSLEDYTKLLFECNEDVILQKVEEHSTPRDGYIPFYSFDELKVMPEFVAEFLLEELMEDNEDYYEFFDDPYWVTDEVYPIIEEFKLKQLEQINTRLQKIRNLVKYPTKEVYLNIDENDMDIFSNIFKNSEECISTFLENKITLTRINLEDMADTLRDTLAELLDYNLENIDYVNIRPIKYK